MWNKQTFWTDEISVRLQGMRIICVGTWVHNMVQFRETVVNDFLHPRHPWRLTKIFTVQIMFISPTSSFTELFITECSPKIWPTDIKSTSH